MSSEDKTISAPIIEMLTVANEYCFFLDHAEEKKKEQLLVFMQRILPLLYLKGSLLPGIEPEYPEANELFVTEELWESVFTNLRKILGDEDEFMIIDPQYINDTEPLKASISENLSDVYQDLKDFLWLYQRNTHAARENAANNCEKLFATHWGFRIGNVLGRIHYLLHNETEDFSSF
ncbi:MAG: DUF5063 domain-containing protein [Bacteroidales bacterium]|jgi:hypothetical protein|nr:DUF5063 domain-containing protein [Bacteroidales bacterium]